MTREGFAPSRAALMLIDLETRPIDGVEVQRQRDEIGVDLTV
jgi:hypothetical protein